MADLGDQEHWRAEIVSIEDAVRITVSRMTQPHEQDGYPTFARFLGISALIDLAIREMQDVIAEHPEQRGRCIAYARELASAVAPPSQERAH